MGTEDWPKQKEVSPPPPELMDGSPTSLENEIALVEHNIKLSLASVESELKAIGSLVENKGVGSGVVIGNDEGRSGRYLEALKKRSELLDKLNRTIFDVLHDSD